MNELDLKRCSIGLANSRCQEKWKEWKLVLSVRKGFAFTLRNGHTSVWSDMYRRFGGTLITIFNVLSP